MQKNFNTLGPIALYVEIGSGNVEIEAGERTETTVTVDGKDADEVSVEQRGNQIAVVAPRQKLGFFSFGSDLRVHVSMPTDSGLVTKLGSANLVATGRLGTSKVRTGSGEVEIGEIGADAVVETGSGEVRIEAVSGALRAKSGSGNVAVGRVGRSTVISTGSGNVEIGTAQGNVHVKSGSGDTTVREAQTDLSLSTASGDLEVGRFNVGSLQAKNVSGDIHLGIPAGIPVWTDINCVTGNVTSDLEGAGRPEKGQEYIEIRAKSVSGDIVLEQL
jgi:hypothetical protein